MKDFLVFLLFLAPTIHYRVELGPFSFALMEPVVLLVAAILLSYQLAVRRKLVIGNDPLVPLFLIFALWVSLVRLLGPDLRRSLSDLRDWIIPILGFVALVMTQQQGWRRYVKMPVIIAVLQSALGLYQASTDSFRPFVSATSTGYLKTVFFAGPSGALPRASFAVGLFLHPNAYGFYVLRALLVWLGFWLASRKRFNIFMLLSGVVLASGLYFSYAKTSILLVPILLVMMLLRRYREFLWLFPLAPVLGFALSILPLFSASVSVLIPWNYPVELSTLFWRFRVWQDSLAVIAKDPFLVFIGNGDFSLSKLWGITYIHPHNLPLFFLLSYGIPGLVWLMAYTLVLRRIGIGGRYFVQRVPLLAALYLGLAAALMAGMVEVLSMVEINGRMNTLLFAVCLVGLRRELQWEKHGARSVAPGVAGDEAPAYPKGYPEIPALAHSHLVRNSGEPFAG